jgi:carboxyl-terminal processing protease
MKYLTPFIILFLVLTGCKKVLFGEDPANTPENNFEIFWNDFDKNYSQFQVRNINWDSVYTLYRPGITSYTTEDQLYHVLANLVYTINDMHVSLYTPYRTAVWKSKAFGSYPTGRYINLCQYLVCDGSQNIPIFSYREVRNDNIGYISISTFQGEGSGLDLSDSRYDLIDAILEQFKDKQGIIIDVRANPGGEVFNAIEVASRFADEKRVYAKYCIKNGPGRNDFSEWRDQYVMPSGKFQFKKPIVVITSRSTCSAAEQFVLAMKTFPYVATVGDTTGGGFGLPMYRELPNGWSYRLSTTIGSTSDNFIIEGKGISPDVPVLTTREDSINGHDRLMESSIELLKMKMKQ